MTYLMTADEAVRLVRVFGKHGVDACVGGGWGVDALLGQQTRDHVDLDVWLPAGQFENAMVALVSAGVDRIHPWPGDKPWNFVVHDSGRRRMDLHIYETRTDGMIHYGSAVAGESFPAAALDGSGIIAGVTVRCEAPEWSVRWHTGYAPRDKDRHDVPLVCARFGIALPAAYQTSPLR